ncbi:hypothetical protein PENSPDRAFT_577127, partial [Peniophora sp. CONT]
VEKDRQRLLLPTWITPSPPRAGDGKHGKLIAEEWHTLGLYLLPFTLARLWGKLPLESRKNRMLHNYMDMTTGLTVGAHRSTDDDRTALQRHAMISYLSGVGRLFPGVAISPAQHFACHFSDIMSFMGPTHAWRCYAPERWNGLLQDVNTNHHAGTTGDWFHFPNADAFESIFR